MSYYVYLIASNERKFIHTGLSKDIKKAVEFYKSMPSGKDYHQLVYLEIWTNEKEAKDRFEIVSNLKKEDKIELIKSQNPEFIELMPGVNIEL